MCIIIVISQEWCYVYHKFLVTAISFRIAHVLYYVKLSPPPLNKWIEMG